MIEKFDTLEHESKGDLIYARLAQALMQGQLRPDQRLKIRDLAEQMGTSVTPVRDAILRLVQDEALLLVSPRDIRVPSLSLAEYIEIRNIRVELEGMAAAQAAIKATPEDVDRLHRLVEDNEKAMKEQRYSDAIRLNQAFHFEFCRIAGLPVMQNILTRLWLRIGPLIAQEYERGGREMIDYHYPVLAAIRHKDAKAARIALQADLLAGGLPLLASKIEEESGTLRIPGVSTPH